MNGPRRSRGSGPPTPTARRAPRAPEEPPAPPLDDSEIDELQALLEAVPAPLEALDASMLDGYLCGVLVQPQPIAVGRWWPFVLDVDGRVPPTSFDGVRLRALALRRHAELERAIAGRRWFDPWVFEPDADAGGEAHEPTPSKDREHDHDGSIDDSGNPSSHGAVYPWVTGFITALEVFPALMAIDPDRLVVPLALLYRHFSPDDLEDAEDVLEEIESLEPLRDLGDAIEGLVRATLLLADVAAES